MCTLVYNGAHKYTQHQMLYYVLYLHIIYIFTLYNYMRIVQFSEQFCP